MGNSHPNVASVESEENTVQLDDEFVHVYNTEDGVDFGDGEMPKAESSLKSSPVNFGENVSPNGPHSSVKVVSAERKSQSMSVEKAVSVWGRSASRWLHGDDLR